jgi:hypothetical protein
MTTQDEKDMPYVYLAIVLMFVGIFVWLAYTAYSNSAASCQGAGGVAIIKANNEMECWRPQR